jgi:hypothetical protein
VNSTFPLERISAHIAPTEIPLQNIHLHLALKMEMDTILLAEFQHTP